MIGAAEFANLSIRFGEKELLDYFSVVSRALLDDTLVRKYGGTTYHFYEMKYDWGIVGDPLSLRIYGRFVKASVLHRDQVLRDGVLVQSEAEIDTAPSAFFVLFIADHRLAYYPETRFAPPISALEATLNQFVKRSFNDFVNQFYREMKSQDKSFTRKMAFRAHVPPSVNLVPLTSSERIQAFINRFATIKRITVHIVSRNQDLSGGGIFDALYGESEEIGAATAKFQATGGDDGLNIPKTKAFVDEVTEAGYERVDLSGFDQENNILKGTNEDFSLKKEIALHGLSDAERANKLEELYLALKESGTIRVEARDANLVAEKVGNALPGE